MPCVEHVLHGQLCLRALALGQLLLLDDLGLFDPDLVCDRFALAGRIAAEPYAQLPFFELQPDGSQRIARPGTQRHFAVRSPEAVAVAKVNTDTFLPGVDLVRCGMKLSTDSVRKSVHNYPAKTASC
jgi:GAF domain-containing protein